MLAESLYSDTVYAADGTTAIMTIFLTRKQLNYARQLLILLCMTPKKKRIFQKIFPSQSVQGAHPPNRPKFLINDIDTKYILTFSENKSVAVGAEFTPTDQPIISINDTEPESESDDSSPGDSYLFTISSGKYGYRSKILASVRTCY